MSKVFSQDKEVITADESNTEATFIVVNKIDQTADPIIQASLNFKEQ